MASRVLSRPTAVAVAAVLVVCGTTFAPPPNFLMTWDVSNDGIGQNTYNWTSYGNQPAFGSWIIGQGPLQTGPWTGWNYNGDLPGPSGLWNLHWDCVFNNDVGGVATGAGAFVTANIVVTNNDVFTQNFNLLMTLPVLRVISPAPKERGSNGGTVTDLTGDSATVSAPAGSRIYTPRIDGADEFPGFLMVAPFSTTAGFFNSVNFAADFGIPVTVQSTQVVDTSIAIRLNFDLTAGDSASFTSIFEVIPIPGPGGIAILAALGLMRRRRR